MRLTRLKFQRWWLELLVFLAEARAHDADRVAREAKEEYWRATAASANADDALVLARRRAGNVSFEIARHLRHLQLGIEP